MADLTPYQTVGPYLHIGLREGRGPMSAPTLTTPIVISGRLFDGAGAGIGDGVVEFWAKGFDAIGRVWTEPDGSYRLTTWKPLARTEADGSMHAPHLAVRVLARGILTQYITRVYFADETTNDRDMILGVVPANRRDTLIAAAIADAEYHFDIVVQGDRETVFFAI